MYRTQLQIIPQIAYPGIDESFEYFKNLVSSLSLTDTLFWIGRINLLISNPFNRDHNAKQSIVLNDYYSADAKYRINKFVTQSGGTNRVAIVYRANLMELLRWVCLFCQDVEGDGRTFELEKNRHAFGRALLLAGSHWAKRRYENIPNLNLRGILADNAHSLPWHIAFSRGERLYKNYLRQECSGIERAFRNSAGLGLESYYDSMRILAFMYLYVTLDNLFEGAGMLNITTGLDQVIEPSRSDINRVIGFESQSPEEFKEWFTRLNPDLQATNVDDTPLKQRPMLKTKDGRIIILDPVLFTQRATMGAYYALLNTLPPSDERVSTISAAFGGAFEQYAGDLLSESKDDNIYYSRDPKARDQLNQQYQVSDYCFIDNRNLFLIEAKAVKEPPESTLNNPRKYISYLRKHYSNNSEQQKKGTGQLARSINMLLDSSWIAEDSKLRDTITLKRNLTIYPVLLVHDDLVAIPTQLEVLADDFEKYLTPDHYMVGMSMKKHKCHIHRLIVLTMTELEMIQWLSTEHRILGILSDFVEERRDKNTSLMSFLSAHKDYRQKVSERYWSPAGMREEFEMIDKLGITLFGRPIRNQE